MNTMYHPTTTTAEGEPAKPRTTEGLRWGDIREVAAAAGWACRGDASTSVWSVKTRGWVVVYPRLRRVEIARDSTFSVLDHATPEQVLAAIRGLFEDPASE